MIKGGATTVLYSLAGIIVFVALWWSIVWYWQPPEFLLPPPSEVFQAIGDHPESLLRDGGITAYEVLLGFALACVTGVGVALCLHLQPRIGNLVWPAVLVAQITPQIAFAPLLIMWFGIGLVSKVIIAALIAFFPILVNSFVGLRSIDIATEDLAKSMLAGRTRYLLEFELPNALPFILSGMKVAMTYSVVGAVVAEFISSNDGLGNLILVADGSLEIAYAIAALFALSAMGMVLFAIVAIVERLLIPWHISQRHSANSQQGARAK